MQLLHFHECVPNAPTVREPVSSGYGPITGRISNEQKRTLFGLEKKRPELIDLGCPLKLIRISFINLNLLHILYTRAIFGLHSKVFVIIHVLHKMSALQYRQRPTRSNLSIKKELSLKY